MFIYYQKPEDDLEKKSGTTASDAMSVLKTGGSEIAGQEITNPESAYANLEFALSKVKEYFNVTLKIDLNDIQFEKFHGDIVGESKESGTFIDPVMLMHPAMRLAHVISHELAHQNNTIQNEGLVESFVDQFFGDDGVEHGYDEALKHFAEFAKRFDKSDDAKLATTKIYELYYNEKFESIYKGYHDNYVKNLKTDEEKDEAFQLFKTVFPELEYGGEKMPGDFELKDFS